MLNALPPFYHENIEKMYELIKSADIKFSKRVSISDEAKDLIIKVSIKLFNIISYWIEIQKKDLEEQEDLKK